MGTTGSKHKTKMAAKTTIANQAHVLKFHKPTMAHGQPLMTAQLQSHFQSTMHTLPSHDSRMEEEKNEHNSFGIGKSMLQNDTLFGHD